eukprot:PhM_4_TR13350/c3_g4_i1/m.14041
MAAEVHTIGVSRDVDGIPIVVRLDYSIYSKQQQHQRRVLTIRCLGTTLRDLREAIAGSLNKLSLPKPFLSESDEALLLRTVFPPPSAAGSSNNKSQMNEAASAAAASKKEAAPAIATDIGALYRDPDEALRNADLTSVPEAVELEYKAKMNETFAANAVVAGQEGH